MIGIFASSQNHCIGRENKLPWFVREDLQFFKKQTNGHILIMGRNTFESLPNGGLPNRIHIVITNRPEIQSLQNKNNVYFCTMNDVFDTVNKVKEVYNDKKVFIIGGASIFHQLSSHIHQYFVTHIDKLVNGDVYFNIDTEQFPHSMIINKTYSDHENCSITWICYSKTSNIL
jgi:dihydrofolate reductase